MKRFADTDFNKLAKKAKLLDILMAPEQTPDHENKNEEETIFHNLFNKNSGVSCRGNHIYFKTDVTDDSIADLIHIIDDKNGDFRRLIKNNKALKSAEPNPLYLHITSFGGSLLAGFRAVDAIQRSEIPIYTIVDGHAASAASIMAVVGSKRFMTPSSYVLIHELRSGAWGKFSELEEEIGNLKKMMEDMCEIYVQHSNMKKKELQNQLKHDVWWNTNDCVEKGIVDEVYETSEV